MATAITLIVVIGGGTLLTRFLTRAYSRRQPVLLTVYGAAFRRETDTNKQLPIAGAEVKAMAGGYPAGETRSDSSGFFTLTLRKEVRPDQPIVLEFRHPEYQPLMLTDLAGSRIYLARMTPIPRGREALPNRPEVVVTNVSARYSVKDTTALNVGSFAKPFQVVNTGNVPCAGRPPCSPDERWKATIRSVSFEAPEGGVFRNARVACIAGPCPFTKIESDGFSAGGRTISVSVRNWSDTATFLIEAEVFHPMVSASTRISYPVTFGQALDFTLPGSAEGVSIQADLNGSAIIFPLGPDLFLSWADCNARVNPDQTKVYRCEMKPGYRLP
jgi:hypothetical protein